MSGRRVLVTGVEDALGHKIAERMAARADVEAVIGVAGVARPAVDGIEVVGLSRDYSGIGELLRGRAIDTIIHADRPWSKFGRGGDGAATHVIATMHLAAAAQGAATVGRVVLVSSTTVYPASSRAPLLHPESELLQPRRGTLAASLVEAEGYVRDLATANPNLSASILRLAELAGPGTNDPLAVLLASPVVPAVWGFDPAVQLLHVDDAVAALEHAADHELAGVYNVAADGLVRWRRAARLAGKPRIELPILPTTLLTTMLQWSYRLAAGDDLLAVLRFGRGAATDAVTRSGFQPATTSEQCLPGSPNRARRAVCRRRPPAPAEPAHR